MNDRSMSKPDLRDEFRPRPRCDLRYKHRQWMRPPQRNLRWHDRCQRRREQWQQDRDRFEREMKTIMIGGLIWLIAWCTLLQVVF